MGISKRLAIFLLAAVLAGCGEPTYDTSSEVAMTRSMEEMTADMSAEERKSFKRDLAGLYIVVGLAAASEGSDAGGPKTKVNEMLNGKNAEEIRTLVDDLKAKMRN
jgi:hypothetical protein